jgi:hypothetical protein
MTNNIEPISTAAITDLQLIAYLEGTLNDAEKRKIEAALLDDESIEQALEGLAMLPPSDIKKIKHQLSSTLQNRIHRNEKRKLVRFTWKDALPILIVLGIAILGYLFLRIIK